MGGALAADAAAFRGFFASEYSRLCRLGSYDLDPASGTEERR
jgi:hypothetical protein